MLLKYKNKEITLIECKSFYSRFMGFMLKKNIDKALLFKKCNSIHTCFMRDNIDVIMCDKDNKILYYYNDLGKNKIILPKKGVYKTIELPVSYFNINIGEMIRIKYDVEDKFN